MPSPEPVNLAQAVDPLGILDSQQIPENTVRGRGGFGLRAGNPDRSDRPARFPYAPQIPRQPDPLAAHPG